MNSWLINEKTHCKTFSTLHYVKMMQAALAVFVVLNFIAIAIAVFIPYHISNGISLLDMTNLSNSLWFFYVLVIVVLLEYVIGIITSNLNIRLSSKTAMQIEFDVLRHIKKSEFVDLGKHSDAHLTQRINNDSVCIGDFIIEKVPYFVNNLITVLLIIPLLFSMSLFLGIIGIVVVVIYFSIYIAVKHMYYRLNKSMLESQNAFFSTMSDVLYNILAIKLNFWYNETDKLFVKNATRFFSDSIKFLRLEVVHAKTISLLSRAAYAFAIFIIVHSSSSSNNVAAIGGAFVAVVMYIELLFPALEKLSAFGGQLQRYKVSRDRIGELYDFKLEASGDVLPDGIDTIICKDVKIEINGREIFSIEKAELQKGRIYLVQGKNGSGKTTFTLTLAGIYKLNAGEIVFNGDTSLQLDLFSARKCLFSFAQQDPYFQGGSIKYNLALSGIDESGIDVKIKEKKLPLLSFIEHLPNGFDTEITPKNTKLSGGEKQRISLTRAMIKKASVYIFDEPSNALDTNSVDVFIEELLELKKEAIVLLISHDARFDAIADDVIMFESCYTTT